ncbi:MAG: DNA phosphorothioation-associated putative methyltransferase [Geminocystis sp.]|nr:DNA phosphorothioation-associated putative methyltransferase [Geminocystis sp.]HIK37535.1 DNA phosphorothioation-associated putative methyltransferase [Geminocystis sp. M7585_C2015_104]
MVDNFQQISLLLRRSRVGKLLPDSLYIHVCALQLLDWTLQQYELKARKILPNISDFNVIKFALDEPKISYLFYPDFWENPHPILARSIVVNIQDKSYNIVDYTQSENPPILHRKETFLPPQHPQYEEFAHLTQIEEKLGLLDNPSHIGHLRQWQRLLLDNNICFVAHNLVCSLHNNPRQFFQIERHRAAIRRNTLSRPVRLVLEAGLFQPGMTFFDYGCGHGVDVKIMAEKGYESAGWDPYYFPDNPLKEADIVNLGYVINVIENVTERREALLKAWSLARQILIVSAQVLIYQRKGEFAYGDGIITEKNTFQKYYEQEELKSYIEQVLKREALPMDLGIFLVFRNPQKAEEFRASRFHSRLKSPRVLSPSKKFADYGELLKPLMAFYSERGRLPEKGELPQEAEIKKEFGGYKRAFKVILQATDEQEWEQIVIRRRQDILVYLALSNFRKRPSLRHLSPQLKADIKALFGSYQAACLIADELLLKVGNLQLIEQICLQTPFGKLSENGLLVHINSLDSLPTLLRLYEGCASMTVGRMEGANLVKLHFHLPRISYLFVPNFDVEETPAVAAKMSVDLRKITVKYRDYTREKKPPIITDKNQLIAP